MLPDILLVLVFCVNICDVCFSIKIYEVMNYENMQVYNIWLLMKYLVWDIDVDNDTWRISGKVITLRSYKIVMCEEPPIQVKKHVRHGAWWNPGSTSKLHDHVAQTLMELTPSITSSPKTSRRVSDDWWLRKISNNQVWYRHNFYNIVVPINGWQLQHMVSHKDAHRRSGLM